MELISAFIDIVLHLDRHLALVVENHGPWVYGLLFLIVFCETGLVVTPFLPGDSLLFVAGTLAGSGAMDYGKTCAVLAAASFLGDNTNYWIGRFVGPRVFTRDTGRLLNRRHLDYTERFYERHGGKTIILARFLPIVRTFAPFVAGIGRMDYLRFMAFSAAGALLWIGSLVTAGYLFGNIPVVKNNLSVAILIVIALSVSPGIIEWLRHRRRSRALP